MRVRWARILRPILVRQSGLTSVAHPVASPSRPFAFPIDSSAIQNFTLDVNSTCSRLSCTHVIVDGGRSFRNSTQRFRPNRKTERCAASFDIHTYIVLHTFA